jgi:hypothetical protein
MKIKNIHRIIILSVLAGLLLVNVAWAMPFEPRWSGVLNCSGFYDRALAPEGAKPPCTSICDLYSLLQNIINIAYTYIVFMAMPFWFVYAGVKYILSGANPGYKKEAQTAMKNAATGLVLALSAYAIVNSFFYFLSPAGVPKDWGKMTCDIAPTKWREQTVQDRINPSWVSETPEEREARIKNSTTPVVETCGNNGQTGTCSGEMQCVRNSTTNAWSCVDQSKKYTCSGSTSGQCATGYECKNLPIAGGYNYTCVRQVTCNDGRTICSNGKYCAWSNPSASSGRWLCLNPGDSICSDTTTVCTSGKTCSWTGASSTGNWTCK